MYKINKNNYNKKLNIDNNNIHNILKLLENELNEIEKKEYLHNYKNRIKILMKGKEIKNIYFNAKIFLQVR